MTRGAERGGLVPETSLRDYFHGEVTTVLRSRSVETEPQTAAYLAGLLAYFTRSDRLFERTQDGTYIKPLADCYAEAARSESAAARCEALRRMGDTALFVAGVLSESLRRKALDVGYYVSMGEGAYGYLSSAPAAERRGEVRCRTFAELAENFSAFAEVLAEVSDAEPFDDRDLLRVYDQWLQTGSPRAASQLRRAGIEPLQQARSQHRH